MSRVPPWHRGFGVNCGLGMYFRDRQWCPNRRPIHAFHFSHSIQLSLPGRHYQGLSRDLTKFSVGESKNESFNFLIFFVTCLGGVGTLAYALCQFNPHMKITVCDMQQVVSLAHHFRPSVEACPNQANVSFVVGDFFKADTIPNADLYVLSRILHDWPEEKVDLILSNVFQCLPSGGGLLICAKILNEDKSGPTRALLESLTMLVATGGKERTALEYKQILEKHGFADFQTKFIDDSPYFDAIFCKKM